MLNSTKAPIEELSLYFLSYIAKFEDIKHIDKFAEQPEKTQPIQHPETAKKLTILNAQFLKNRAKVYESFPKIEVLPSSVTQIRFYKPVHQHHIEKCTFTLTNNQGKVAYLYLVDVKILELPQEADNFCEIEILYNQAIGLHEIVYQFKKGQTFKAESIVIED